MGAKKNNKGNKGYTWNDFKSGCGRIYNSKPVQFIGKVGIGTAVVALGTRLGRK
jgi:hypothetical protein